MPDSDLIQEPPQPRGAYVTIPLTLFERMARLYYSSSQPQVQIGPRPAPEPPTVTTDGALSAILSQYKKTSSMPEGLLPGGEAAAEMTRAHPSNSSKR